MNLKEHVDARSSVGKEWQLLHQNNDGHGGYAIRKYTRI